MTLDERITKLVESQERLIDSHKELAESHKQLAASQNQLAESQKKTELMLAGVVESIKRLERIAGVLLLNDEELDRRLTELEGKARRKLQ